VSVLCVSVCLFRVDRLVLLVWGGFWAWAPERTEWTVLRTVLGYWAGGVATKLARLRYVLGWVECF